MRPYVILHNAVSADGRIDGFAPEIGLFYEIARSFKEDATLAGCDTLLEATAFEPLDEPEAPPPEKAAGLPLLICPDSRGRCRKLHHFRHQPYWRDVVGICCTSTPREHVEYLQHHNIEFLMAGTAHVDYREALEELYEDYAIRTLRIDSGGKLNAVLAEEGLVDEVSILLHPVLAGGAHPRSFLRHPETDIHLPQVPMELKSVEEFENGLLWIRWLVVT